LNRRQLVCHVNSCKNVLRVLNSGWCDGFISLMVNLIMADSTVKSNTNRPLFQIRAHFLGVWRFTPFRRKRNLCFT